MNTKKLNILYIICVGLALAGLYYKFSTDEREPGYKIPPSVHIESVGDKGLYLVKITPKAAVRIDLKTQTAEAFATVIPYEALTYGTYGENWVYKQLEPLTFIREEVYVDYIEGDKVFLSVPTKEKMEIVTRGVMELFGSESGMGAY